MYHYHSLEDISLVQLAECFNLAFSDYEQSICFTPDSLKYYLTASAVNLSLSFGAFCQNQLVGFILNSNGLYNEQNVVFDAGTGVIPDHRGQKVFSGLFEYTCAQLQNNGIARYYLEVLQSNHHAVAIYQKKGFVINRAYSVLAATGAPSGFNKELPTVPYQEFDAFATAYSVKPSFEHTLHTISQNPQLYEVLCLPDRAYCIYAKRHGAILQMHYHDLDALKEVISALICRYPAAMAKNVDCDHADVIAMLQDLGFTEVTKQFEMVRDT